VILPVPPNYQQLTGFLDRSSVLSEEILEGYSIDGMAPKAVVRPQHRQEIVDVIKWAAAEGAAVFPWGGGTQVCLGGVPDRVDLVLDLSRYNRVIDYQPADLTATVESGISLASLQQELAQGCKFLAIEAPVSSKATVGGILASNASGPLRFGYGLPRDWLIGIGVVNAQGVETKAGGKVVKNVTGYDLGKLYTGSMGTLGIITEATFKLIPLPVASSALAAVFPSMEAAVDAGSQLLKQVFAPHGLQVVDSSVAQRLNLPAPVGVQGPDTPFVGISSATQEAVMLAFFSGRAAAVRRKLDEASRLIRSEGAVRVEEISGPQGSVLLGRIADVGWDTEDPPYIGIKVNVSPSDVPRVVAWFDQSASGGRYEQISLGPEDLPPEIVVDSGFGTVRFLWWSGAPHHGQGSAVALSSDQGWLGRFDGPHLVDLVVRIQALARESGGSVVVDHAPPSLKRQIKVWGEPPDSLEIMRNIKQKFDPAGILNPGRFMGGI
jgi:glycolate oxidase FAD binding subunit